MTDEEAIAAAIEAGWKSFASNYAEWFLELDDQKEWRREIADVVHVVWDLAVTHGREQERRKHRRFNVDQHREQLCMWLRLNGIDPDHVPEQSVLDEDLDAGILTVDYRPDRRRIEAIRKTVPLKVTWRAVLNSYQAEAQS